jgi:hypothetical protein
MGSLAEQSSMHICMLMHARQQKDKDAQESDLQVMVNRMANKDAACQDLSHHLLGFRQTDSTILQVLRLYATDEGPVICDLLLRLHILIHQHSAIIVHHTDPASNKSRKL